MPHRGQCSLLGVRSERLERHDSRARVNGASGSLPTKKKRKYKYDSKESAEDVSRRKRNRARSDRRRRAHKRLMAAEEEKARTRLQRRGGAKSWKQAVKRRYSRDLRLNKQRRKDVRDKSPNLAAAADACVKGGGYGDFAHAALQGKRRNQDSSTW